MKTLMRLLLEEQSDLGLHCLPRPICLKSKGHYCTWQARGTETDPHLRHILFMKISDHESISMAILHLLLIQEEQLSVNGERTYIKYW